MRHLFLPIAIVTGLGLSGCAVVEVGGAVVGAGATVVGTAVGVTGDVVGAAAHTVSGSDKKKTDDDSGD